MVGKFDNVVEENWFICINSCGLVSLFDVDGMMISNFDLVLINFCINEEVKVVIFFGGVMNVMAIVMGFGFGGGGVGFESFISSESFIGGGGIGGEGFEISGGEIEISGGEIGISEKCNNGVGNGFEGCFFNDKDNDECFIGVLGVFC